MKLLLLLPLLLGLMSPAIAHNIFNSPCGTKCLNIYNNAETGEGDVNPNVLGEGEGALINNGTVGSNTDQ